MGAHDQSARRLEWEDDHPGSGCHDEQFWLVLQSDGNLVLSEGGEAVWATGTDGREVSNASMQQDGNLVLYAASGEPVWASQTDGNDGAYLLLQDDRNLVIYSADGSPLWATNTLT